jgi:TRAP-type C4-dicarboxylate transport system permease small subunit
MGRMIFFILLLVLLIINIIHFNIPKEQTGQDFSSGVSYFSCLYTEVIALLAFSLIYWAVQKDKSGK